MKEILRKLEDHSPLDYEALGKLLEEIDFSAVDYESLIPEITSSDSYSRNILTLNPIEVIVLHWPPGVSSAVHHHDGFWGYVAVLQGACENVEYLHKEGVISESQAMRAIKGGLMPEPDGTLHKIYNPSSEESLVTAHFYYPALENMDDMVIYDLEKERIGTLNDKANGASWTEPEEHFKSIQENAFKFIPNAKKKSPTEFSQ